MDERDIAGHKTRWYSSLDEKRQVATAIVWDEDGDEMEVQVPFTWEVCPLCDGRGRHVNPSIDSHGITSEEFLDDPDFAKDYFSGRYDIPCNECWGRRVIPQPDDSSEEGKLAVEAMNRRAEWAREAAWEREMGY